MKLFKLDKCLIMSQKNISMKPIKINLKAFVTNNTDTKLKEIKEGTIIDR